MAMIRFLVFILFSVFFSFGSAFAQGSEDITIAAAPKGGSEAVASPETGSEKFIGREDSSKIIQAPTVGAGVGQQSNAPKKIPSLFFTYWQHQSLVGALRARGKGANAFEAEFEAGAETPEDRGEKKPENREVFVSGIVFVHAKDWTVWMNGMRLTPDSIPPEVVDLKVFQDYIDLKWHDKYTNKIFPIRLRAHQRFNLDSRVFLPG